MSAPLPAFCFTHTYRWQVLQITLQTTRPMGLGTPVLVVLNALLKSVKADFRGKVQRSFHVPHRVAHRLRFLGGKNLPLTIIFCGEDSEAAAKELRALDAYLAQGGARVGFRRVGEATITTRSGSDLAPPPSEPCYAVELNFLSPLPFKRSAGQGRTALTVQGLFTQLRHRADQLFGLAPELPDLSLLNLQNQFWSYTELRHDSKSQPGNTQYFNGCFGALYLSSTADLRPLWSWLQFAAQFHAGGSFQLNPLGYCTLHVPPRPHFDPQLISSSYWQDEATALSEEHDDWLPALAPDYGTPLDTTRLSHALIARLQDPNWQPSPAQAFYVAKKQGKRRLEKLPPFELLLHAGLHHLLRHALDKTLSPAAMGFRRGLSVQAAVAKVESHLAAGHRYVLEADIADFFPSVNLTQLLSVLEQRLPPGDTLLRRVLRQVLFAPWLENGLIHPREHGLAQGSPLSPLLANVYLDAFDQAFRGGEAELVRYADDFVVLTRDRDTAEALLHQASAALAALGLSLSMEKTAIREVSAGFRFLGQAFGGQCEASDSPDLAPPACKTLYLTEPHCFIGHNGDALEVRQEGKLLSVVPFRRINEIVVLSPASFSSGLVQKCSKHDIPLSFTVGGGYEVASIAPRSRRHFALAQQQALHYANLSPTERLILARQFAQQKVANYLPVIRSRYQAGHQELLEKLEQLMAGMEETNNVAAVRGYEGQAARLVQRALNDFIKVPEFHFSKRLREKTDRMNSLFNFAYYLLFARLNTLVRAAGLNPYLGFLHDSDEDYETLVCDFQELFRAPVDRMLLAAVNLHVIQADDFHEGKQGWRLQPGAIKRLLARFEAMLQEDVGGISLLRAMEAQIEVFSAYVRDEKRLWFFHYETSESRRLQSVQGKAKASNPLRVEAQEAQ